MESLQNTVSDIVRVIHYDSDVSDIKLTENVIMRSWNSNDDKSQSVLNIQPATYDAARIILLLTLSFDSIM